MVFQGAGSRNEPYTLPHETRRDKFRITLPAVSELCRAEEVFEPHSDARSVSGQFCIERWGLSDGDFRRPADTSATAYQVCCPIGGSMLKQSSRLTAIQRSTETDLQQQ